MPNFCQAVVCREEDVWSVMVRLRQGRAARGRQGLRAVPRPAGWHVHRAARREHRSLTSMRGWRTGRKCRSSLKGRSVAEHGLSPPGNGSHPGEDLGLLRLVVLGGDRPLSRRSARRFSVSASSFALRTWAGVPAVVTERRPAQCLAGAGRRSRPGSSGAALVCCSISCAAEFERWGDREEPVLAGAGRRRQQRHIAIARLAGPAPDTGLDVAQRRQQGSSSGAGEPSSRSTRMFVTANSAVRRPRV